MNIPETLKARRKMLGITQQELSEISGINRSVICSYETGNRSLSIERVEMLLNAIGLELCVRRKQK